MSVPGQSRVRCSSASIAATDRLSVMPPRSVRNRSIRAVSAARSVTVLARAAVVSAMLSAAKPTVAMRATAIVMVHKA
jgi:hypothetical protein